MTNNTSFAIRDDDTSFFTSPDQLENIYSPYWGKVPISLAVVPFSVSCHRGRSFSDIYPCDKEMPLGDNKSLVEWLQEKILLGHIEIMLHGYSHCYKRIKGSWVGEYGWKGEEQLAEETKRGKTYLEDLLNVRIKVFVPPSNTIGKAGIRAIRRTKLNLSGIMGHGGDRPWTADYPLSYIKRWGWWALRGTAYPYPLEFGGIRELRAHALTPSASLEILIRDLETCAAIKAPFVMATHYWEFISTPSMHRMLALLIDNAQKHDLKCVLVSDCF